MSSTPAPTASGTTVRDGCVDDDGAIEVDEGGEAGEDDAAADGPESGAGLVGFLKRTFPEGEARDEEVEDKGSDEAGTDADFGGCGCGGI